METQPAKWEIVKSLFEAAQDLPPEEVAQFLADRCQDPDVCREVQRLLSEYREASGFLSSPAVARLWPSDSVEFSAGEVIAGRYKIVEFVAAGGMGVVYKAEDPDLRRFVALKFLPSESATDPQAQARLKREAQAASALNHPNICTIYEVGNHAGGSFIAMEFLDGMTLKQRLGEGLLDIGTVINLSIEITDALEAAHSASVLHRDIKPANIFITQRGHAKILDFGIAKVRNFQAKSEPVAAAIADGLQTAAGTIAGTAAYMAPEQIRGEELDARTDLFSFGITLYAMATGCLPFEAPNAPAVCQAILNAKPVPPSEIRHEVPPKLEAVIQKSLKKDRNSRYQRAAEIRDELTALRRQNEFATQSELLAAKTQTRRRIWYAAVAAVLFAGIAGWLHWRKSSGLTEKDSVVLADFANTTDDPVFAEALKAGLAADLGQSPFLNILSYDDVTKQLRYMGRPPDSPLTPEIARQVCQRAGSKAMLTGSIATLGTHYAITLSASDCASGKTLGMEQEEAPRREEVLSRLHQAARRLRGQLGESLASVGKYDAPLEQATTSSLEALQIFSVAITTWRSQGDATAVPLFQRALQLDPSFALAYSDMGTTYCNLGETALCAQFVGKAYELRGRVSEREKLLIESNYYLYVTGELEKALQVFQAWKQIYPRTPAAYIQSGLVASELGRLDSALDNDLQAFRLKSNNQLVYQNLSYDYMYLDRLDQAKALLSEARERKLDESLLENSYQLAFLLNDTKEEERCLAASKGKPEFESAILASQSDTEAFHGRLSNAREFSRRAIASALAAGSKETAAEWQVTSALREAELGNKIQAVRDASAALALSPTRNVQVAASLAFARAGSLDRAEAIAKDLEKRFATDTLMTNYWLPSIRAAIQIARKNPSQAIDELQVAESYELGGNQPPFTSGGTLYPAYLRGQAYLFTKQWEKAAAEFQKIVDHRGLVWNFTLGALANLQLARAYAGSGDLPRAEAAYRSFLTLWQDGDSDVSLLAQAKMECSKLH